MGAGVSGFLKMKIVRFFLSALATVLSAFLLVLSYPPYEFGWMAWVALVPLLLAIPGRSLPAAFLLSFLWGVVFLGEYFSFNLATGSYKYLHHALLGFCYPPLFGVFGLSFCLISRRVGLTAGLFLAPFLWVSLEYLRANFFFLAMPMGLLAYSQYQSLLVVQIASVAGSYGISFLIVLVNSAVAALILFWVNRLRSSPSALLSVSGRGAAGILIPAALLFVLTLAYGWMIVSKPIAGKAIKISLVQGNIDQDKKWDPKYAHSIMQTYADLSAEASKAGPGLIVWPEAATPGLILKRINLLTQMRALIREAGTHLLLGSSEYPKFAKDPVKQPKGGNTALFFSPEGKVLGQYLKIKLIPFAEYVPFEGTIPWPEFIVPEKKSSHIAGDEITLFELNGTRFGALICWEAAYPELVRRFVKEGAEFVVNLTNEAWFGRSPAARHSVTSIVFRAVENRIFVVRCANTGVSCFIDPCGRIMGRVKDETGNDLFVRGILTESVIPMAAKSFYTRYGDWVVWLCVGLSVVFLIYAFGRRKPEGA